MAMSPRYLQYLYTQEDLLSRVINFNAEFSRRQTKNRVNKPDAVPQDSLEKIHPHLAQFKERHHLKFNFEHVADRLCLIKNEELDALSIYLGACISSNQLAKFTEESQKEIIYESIGRAAYEFAINYGYIIKNFDFNLNLNALHKDFTYLGLVALKRMVVMFSSEDLSDYFVDLLIRYTKSRNLDPNIVIAESHVLHIEDVPVSSDGVYIDVPAPVEPRTRNQHQFASFYEDVQLHGRAPRPNMNFTAVPEIENAPRIGKHRNTPERNVALSIAAAGGIKNLPKVDEEALAQSAKANGSAIPKNTNVVKASTSKVNGQKDTIRYTDGSIPAESVAQQVAELHIDTPKPTGFTDGSLEDAVPLTAEGLAPAPKRNEGPAMSVNALAANMAQSNDNTYGGGYNSAQNRAMRNATRQGLSGSIGKRREIVSHDELVTLDFSPQQVLTLSTLILQYAIDPLWAEYLS